MIRKGKNKVIVDISRSRRDMMLVYYGKYLVWQKANQDYTSGSCYGTGHWINEFPWSETDAWRNA